MLLKNGVLPKLTVLCVIDIIVTPSVSNILLQENFVQNTSCIAYTISRWKVSVKKGIQYVIAFLASR